MVRTEKLASPRSLQLKRGAFLWQQLTHQARSVFQAVPTALLSSSPPSTFCLWVALHVTDRPSTEARWPACRPLPAAVYGGSVIQALIIPAGQELPLPCSLDCGVWLQRERQRGFSEQRSHTHHSVCAKYLFYPFVLSSNITNKGKSFYYSSLPQGRL